MVVFLSLLLRGNHHALNNVDLLVLWAERKCDRLGTTRISEHIRGLATLPANLRRLSDPRKWGALYTDHVIKFLQPLLPEYAEYTLARVNKAVEGVYLNKLVVVGEELVVRSVLLNRR